MGSPRIRANFLIFSLLIFTPYSWTGDPAPTITNFAPEGMIKGVRQARAAFSQPMVTLGDPKGAADPFTIVCPAPGHGRWADGRNWVYDFDKDIPGGIACSFKIKSDLKSIAGVPFAGRTEFKFDTGGPAMTRSQPWQGSPIDEEQIFILSLDVEAEAKTVLQHAYFEVEGIAQRVPVTILEDDPRKAAGDQGFGAKVRIWARKFGNANHRVGTRRTGVAEILIQAKQRFPPDTKVSLVWGAGITAPSGIATQQDQTFHYKVRREFSAEFTCDRENAHAACLPMLPMLLRFNADVAWSDAQKIRLRSKTGQEWKPHVPNEKSLQDDSGVSHLKFDGPFPEKTDYQIILPSGLKDDAGRSLTNASRFPLTVSTADFPPLIKFAANFGILESKPEAVLPVTVRNVEPELALRLGDVTRGKTSTDSVEGKMVRMGVSNFTQLVRWLGNVSTVKRDQSLFADTGGFKPNPITIRKPNGDKAFEVIGIPLQKTGLYVLEFASERLGKSLLGGESPMYVSSAALVTNLSVHLKEGRESSMVWVTTLDQAKPVEGAAVSIRTCGGELLASGKTDTNGIAKITKDISEKPDSSCNKEYGYSQFSRGIYVIAEKDDDFSFVHSSWQKGIEPWRYSLRGGYALTPRYATTVFDRTLFRTGETVHLKHYFRKHSMAGIEGVESSELPKAMQIRHQESNQTYELPIKWRNNGVSENTWAIPKGAKLGVYTVTLLKEATELMGNNPEKENHPGSRSRGFHHARSRYGGSEESWASGEFRVEEFRVPLMKGQLKTPTQDLVSVKEVPIDLSVEYLSGGTAAKLPIQIRHQLSNAPSIEFVEFEGYQFGTGKFNEPNGDLSSLAPGEMELDLDPADPTSTTGPEGASKAEKHSLTLNQTGTAHDVIEIKDRNADKIRNLHVEMDYRDPNGETQTVARSVMLYPSQRLIGIKPDGWYATKKGLKFQVAVTDLRGKPAARAPVEVEFIENKTLSHRKRLVGGLYAYENKSEVKRHGTACKGTTDDKGLLACNSVPPVSGNLVLEAKTADGSGNDSFGTSSTWVYDSEEWWFSQEDSDRIDLLPERKRYEPGQKAIFQVRMPFREATALVTVEREGILDSFVVPLNGKKPLVEVPIKPNYSPNVFVSVMVVRGRVGDVQPTALVDLGRPAYKLGISEINVGWQPHELKVQVTAIKPVYQIREMSSVKVKVKAADGSPLQRGSELAIAVVDEGLLELKPNDSWKLLEAMMRPRGYEVATSTAQSEVIGKRHFGLKALPPGGDGGKAPARELFDTLLYWNSNVILNENGEANIQFPLNDSMTSFKIAAIANAGSDRFGSGYTTIRATKDLMILSGIPPLAREGDHLPLEFTVRNSTNKPMSASLSGKAGGISDLPAQEIALAANEAKVVRWVADIPSGVSSVKYEVEVKEKSGKAADRILVSQKVIPAIPVRVLQSTLEQVDDKFKIDVEKPKNAVVGRGGIRVILDSTLLTGLDGVRDYMGDYPYTCMEQRVSKAIALQDKKQWKTVVEDLPSYLDGDGLVKYFPSDWIHGSDILTSYLLSISNEAGWDIPAETRGRIIQGLVGFVEGRIIRIGDLPTADLAVRKIAALEALSRYGEAHWQMTGSLQISPNLWPTSAVIDWLQLLKRLKDAPQAEVKVKEADQILRSRLNFQGTMMGFSTENVDNLWWMMVSTSVNANRFLLTVSEDPTWKQDMGRVARGALYRQKQGHWDTTTANAWGVLAMNRFASLFEKNAVSGTTKVSSSDQKERELSWTADPHGKTLDLNWPTGPGVVKINHSGKGKPWATIQSRAAIPLTEKFSTGYQVSKSWTALEQKVQGKWSKGDIVRVHLDMESQSDMTWVVLNDPIPAGAAILGSGLGNDSSIASSGEKSKGWAEPAFQERAFDGYRAYYQYVPKGKWMTEYTIRLNQSGKMNLPPTRLEAMYAPEMFGEIPNEAITVVD